MCIRDSDPRHSRLRGALASKLAHLLFRGEAAPRTRLSRPAQRRNHGAAGLVLQPRRKEPLRRPQAALRKPRGM
eukprot:7226015-Alexandrium_andersonii.AAC.1